MVNHYGGVGAGHYTAFAFNQEINSWVEFNDTYLYPVKNKKDIITDAAYLLFYRKKKI